MCIYTQLHAYVNTYVYTQPHIATRVVPWEAHTKLPRRHEGCKLTHVLQDRLLATARLAQSAERKALNLVVVGSSPTVGVCLFATRSRARCYDATHYEVSNNIGVR